jgi:hypothetical protein
MWDEQYGRQEHDRSSLYEAVPDRGSGTQG